MPHVLEPGDIPSHDTDEPEEISSRSGFVFAWETIARCIVLGLVVVMISLLSWRPALLRFSQLLFFVSPSHGDSLAWKPDGEEEPRPAPRKHTLAPAEWRLTSSNFGSWKLLKGSEPVSSASHSQRLIDADWRRLSYNPWAWQDDVGFSGKRLPTETSDPDQQPATAYRVKADEVWRTEQALERAVDRPDTSSSGTASLSGLNMPSLAPEPLAIPALRPLVKDAQPESSGTKSDDRVDPAAPSTQASTETDKALVVDTAPEQPERMTSLAHAKQTREKGDSDTASGKDDVKPIAPLSLPGLLELSPLSFDELDLSGQRSEDVSSALESLLPDEPVPGIPGETGVLPGLPTQAATQDTKGISLPDSLNMALDLLDSRTRSKPESSVHTRPTESETVQQDTNAGDSVLPETEAVAAIATSSRPAARESEAVSQNWANTEITHPIPGAYLTIYPKLKFIGLCVPGQGYVRKYNQVAMPRDLDRPKFEAHDGRTPYGKYFIAGRNRGNNGATLLLSWPSPEDAQRVGLSPEQTTEIENAWLSLTLPLQNTDAGGGLMLTGDRDTVEETDGGFSLELPHMEEIFTALPDGAWVFIQQ